MFRPLPLYSMLMPLRASAKFDPDQHANRLKPRLLNSGADRTLSAGYVSIQANSHPIEFRRIEILPLD